MKKILLIMIAIFTVLSFAGCGSVKTNELKVGVIFDGEKDEMKDRKDQIELIAEDYDLPVEFVYGVDKQEDDIKNAVDKLTTKSGCDLVIFATPGYEEIVTEKDDKVVTEEVAKEHAPDVFAVLTNAVQEKVEIGNYNTAFIDDNESRYIAGVVAGEKLNELVSEGKISPDATPEYYEEGNIKIGYVMSADNDENKAGASAFCDGVKSVCENVVMKNGASDKKGEDLIGQSCVVIALHKNDDATAKAVEKASKDGKVCFVTGYGKDLSKVAPKTALVSAKSSFEAYCDYLMDCVKNNKKIETDKKVWHEINLTELTANCAENTKEKVEAALKEFQAGKQIEYTVSEAEEPVADSDATDDEN